MKSVSKSFKMVAMMAATTGMVLSSCTHESVYDPNYANKVLQQNWQEKVMDGKGEIDAKQDWSMAEEVKANMAIFGMDGLSDYKLKLYTDNPLSNAKAQLIASVSVRTDASGSANVTMPVDVCKSQTIFYACYEDSHNRRNVKPVGLINGEIDAIFGLGAATRGSLSSDGLVIPQVEDPSNAVNAKYAQAEEVNASNSYVNWSGSSDFATVLKIGENNTWKGEISVGASENELGRTIYVDGTWDLTNTTEQRIGGTGLVVVRPGGKILLGKNTKFVTDNHGRLVVMAGASIEGPGLVEFANGTTPDCYNYNAGTIDVGMINNNGGDFYNYSDVKVDVLGGGAGNSVYVNWGKTVINSTSRYNWAYGVACNASNLRIKNGCQLEVTKDLFCRNLDMGTNSYALINGSLQLEDTSDGTADPSEILMANASYLVVKGGVALNNSNIVGPTPEKQWAVCQFGKIGASETQTNYEAVNGNLSRGYVINNLYISIDEQPGVNAPTDYYNPRGNAYAAFTLIMMNGIDLRCDVDNINPLYLSSTPVGNGNAHLVNKGEANIVIPEDCSPGYTPVEPDPTPEIPQTFIFACEDLGTSDDFDFNDIVFSVSYVAGKTEATVTALAAGGTLNAEIVYDGQSLGEVHGMLGAAAGEMVNTTEGITHRHAGVKISVPSNWTLAENYGKFAIAVQENEASKVVTSPADAVGRAPQMILLPEGWEWPKERISIVEAYPDFINWVKDASLTSWNEKKVDDKVIKR